MQPEVRVFKAESMKAALDLVQHALGPEAVILHTRQIEKRRWFPWGKRRQEVEITAGLGIPTRARDAAASAGSPRNFPHEDAPGSAAVTNPSTTPPNSVTTTRSADVAPSNPSGRHHVQPPKWSPYDVIPDDALGVPQVPSRKVPTTWTTRPSEGSPTAPPDRSATQTWQNRQRWQQRWHQADLPHDDASSPLSTTTQPLQPAVTPAAELWWRHLPPVLFSIYTELLERDMDEDTARDLVLTAHNLAGRTSSLTARLVWSLLTGLVERELTIAGPLSVQTHQRQVVAFVGPTGVGKTTTIAKLAAHYHLREGYRVGLLTIDTYRIAAVDQLQTYADLIRVPLKVVHRPEEMPRALEALNQTELVLIDTAGRSPLDNLNLRELQEFLSAGKVSQVQLLLSMTSSRRSLRQAWSQFQPLRPTALILTKMDEAATLGEAFALCKATQLPVSYLTTGQGVPDDIEPAQAGRLARWILGLQSVVQVDDPLRARAA